MTRRPTSEQVGGSRPGRRCRYVLVTPARNEDEFIGRTIASMVSQTVRPERWVIVSDGSTDGTDDIVTSHLGQHRWIELVKMTERKERHFAGKVQAFNAGYARLKGLDFEVIGNLDADVSFEPDYVEYLLDQFAANPRLGVAGTNRWEGSLMYDFRFSNVEDVAGACQLFRRECFEAIGGYQPIRGGGIDLVAMLTARMRGWETRTFTERILRHHRPSGTASAGRWKTHYIDGRKDYMFGSHPLWELFRTFYRMKRNPYVLSGLLLFSGYLWSMLSGVQRPISPELIRFRRREQMSRLHRFLLTLPFLNRGDAGVPTNPAIRRDVDY